MTNGIRTVDGGKFVHIILDITVFISYLMHRAAFVSGEMFITGRADRAIDSVSIIVIVVEF